MNINWDEMPDWADVWIESVSGNIKPDWYKDDGDRWVNETGNCYWLKPIDVEYYIVHHPTTKQWSGPEDFLPPNGYQLVSEDAIKWLFKNHPDIYDGFYDLVDSPPKSDREKWVEQAIKIASKSAPECDVTFSQVIYDALQSGELPMPEVKK